MKTLTDEKRKDVFIIDDRLFDRSRSKKTEFLANVFDHCSMKYKKGFRMLTLGWSDGNSFVPVNYCLLSTAEDKNLLCRAKKFDGRSIAGKRRSQSRRKATDVMLELIASAQAAGLSARYVLFDSWFFSPKALISLKEKCHMDTIAMIKKNKTKYLYEVQSLNIKQIYNKNRKRRRRSKYLISVDVTLKKDGKPFRPESCVSVMSSRKDWLALISTDTNLSEEEIIRVYGKRWVEVLFKSCKSYLKLVKECRSISYDALNAHVAIVFTIYMLLSVAKRRNEDDKTI